MNLLFTDIENMVTEGETEGGTNWEYGINRYKLHKIDKQQGFLSTIQYL